MTNITKELDILFDKTCEHRMIGILFKKPEIMFQTPWFKSDYFHIPICKALYDSIFILLKHGQKTVTDFVLKDVVDKTEPIKYAVYESLTTSFPWAKMYHYFENLVKDNADMPSEYKTAAKEVISFAYRRDVVNKIQYLKDECFKLDGRDINALNLHFQKTFNKLSESYIVNQEIKPIGECMDAIWKQIEDMRNDGVYGIHSKYDKINEYFTYQPGELVVIGGRAKAGKSTFFLNEIVHKLETYQGMGCAIFDTEMSDRMLLPRMIALKSGIPQKELTNGTYLNDKRKVEAFKNAYDWWQKQKFVHLYDTKWDFDKIYAAARILKTDARFNLGFLVFDYIKDTGSKDFDGEKLNYALGSFTNFLKNNIAGELDIPVVAGAQLSPSDVRLADSDSINRYASVIAYWLKKDLLKHNKEPQDKTVSQRGNYCMEIGYNRLGEPLQDSWINFAYKGTTGNIICDKNIYQPSDVTDSQPYENDDIEDADKE